MKEVIYLLFHLLTTLAKLLRPGGGRTVIAENLILKQQLIIHSRARERAPNLSTQDRGLLGFWSLFLNPRRIARAAIIIKPSTLLRFHSALKSRKYRLLYSPGGGCKPGPKGPSKEVIDAIVEMKQRNPRYGCPRIAEQINLAFGLELDKDVVRRILATHYKSDPSNRGPSWLTTIGHAKDSLWSVDLFRCESILLKSHWVMVVMDQYTRRIIGFGVHAGNVDGSELCRMFNDATSGHDWPKHLSSDYDPLFQYHRWKANLRVLEIDEIKSLPHVPMSHPLDEELKGLQEEQAEIREQLKSLRDDIEELEADDAQNSARQSEQSMEEAEDQMQQGQSQKSKESAEEAREYLEQMKEELEQERRRYESLQQEELLYQLVRDLKDYIEREKQIRVGTAEVIDQSSGRRRLSRVARKKLKALATEQSEIAKQMDERLEAIREENSTAFAVVMEDVTIDMREVEAMLRAHEVGPLLLGVEDEIVHDLEDLVGAFEDEIERRQDEQQEGGGQQQGQQGGGGQGKPPLVPPIVEIKLVKRMQDDLNVKSKRFLEKHPDLGSADELTERERRQLERLSHQQGRLKRVLEDLKRQVFGE